MTQGFHVLALAASMLFLVPSSPGDVYIRTFAAAQQRPVEVVTREYSSLVQRYRDGEGPSPTHELVSWENDDIRRAIQRFAGIIHALKRLFVELAELDSKRRVGADSARYEAQRAELIAKLERLYTAIYTGRVPDPGDADVVRGRTGVRRALATGSWQRGLPESVIGYLRGAVALHTAVAAESWRQGVSGPVVEHLEFAATYLPDLLAPLDLTYGSLWCRTSGAILLASNRYGAALRQYGRCLTWYPRDPWLLLGRGSTRESAALLMLALPPGASFGDWPQPPRDVASQVEEAISDFEAALEQGTDLAEARIRLARLRLHHGDVETAALHLDQVSPESLPRVLAYWASLFRGAVNERVGKPEDAAVHYRAALRLYPDAQTAAVALSHVLAEALDARENALTMLRERIGPSVGRGSDRDPWWFYRMGQAWRAPEWLGEIDRRSRK